MKKRCYITTPIYYPSGNAHLGHTYCTIMADIIARYKRNRGVETYFLTGTDEHGQKIQNNAEKLGLTPQQYVDGIAAKFQDLWKELKISNDDFIRTTQERHIKVVSEVFSRFLKQGDIYLGNYEGWYCVPCESFWTNVQVGEDHLCPDCGRPVNKAREESYFFKCNKYLDIVLENFEKPKFVFPESRKNEMLNNFIKPGLDDLCVSRTSFSWGIQIKENPKHVIYVWLDALINYISALGYLSDDDSLFKKFWDNDDVEIIHLVGADISRFHTIYWPMFLKALNLRQPDRIFVHGLLMTKDGKMSKSKGNVIAPQPLIDRYGLDCLRYYLIREINFGSDGVFTPEQFIERINVDLVNNYGNLVNRSLNMIKKYFDGVIPQYVEGIKEIDKAIQDEVLKTISKYEELMDDLKLSEATNEVMLLVDKANKYIQAKEPWTLAKSEENIDELKMVMANIARVIFVSTMLLKPIIIESYNKVFNYLGIEKEVEYKDIFDVHYLDNLKLKDCDILYKRLNVNEELQYIKDNIKQV